MVSCVPDDLNNDWWDLHTRTQMATTFSGMQIDSSQQEEMGRSVRAAAALPLYKNVLFSAVCGVCEKSLPLWCHYWFSHLPQLIFSRLPQRWADSWHMSLWFRWSHPIRNLRPWLPLVSVSVRVERSRTWEEQIQQKNDTFFPRVGSFGGLILWVWGAWSESNPICIHLSSFKSYQLSITVDKKFAYQ